MKTLGNRRRIIMEAVMALVAAVLAAAGVQAQAAQNATKQPPPLIHSMEGPDLFRAYCAPCHGLDAKGSGTAAPALKAKIPNLTLLTQNNGGQFPATRVRQMILGDTAVAAHGSREMPIWGPIFHQIEADADWGNVRTANLVAYLQSIQSVAVSNVPSGAALYREHCAACHGNDLKGGIPAPSPYTTPPNLTTLARRHGGTFPGAYVANVLRNGVAMPAHGPADMPIWGADFSTDQSSKSQTGLRIASLTSYIKSLQAK